MVMEEAMTDASAFAHARRGFAAWLAQHGLTETLACLGKEVAARKIAPQEAPSSVVAWNADLVSTE